MFLTKSLLHTTDTYVKKLREAGIETVRDFLSLFPRGIEDKSDMIEDFSMVNIREKQAIKCTIELLTEESTRNKKLLIKAVLTDKSGFHAEAVWWNRRMLLTQYRPGDTVIIYGQAKYEYGRLSWNSADIEHFRETRREVVPVYSDVNYIPGTWIREKMNLLKPYIEELTDEIPESIKAKKWLRPRNANIRDIHFPHSIEAFERAKRELGYAELFDFQRRGIEKKYQAQHASEWHAVATPIDTELMKELIAGLPFPLTNKQKIVLFQILKDMEQPHAMARLLQWDVGTGKTVVALLASIHIIKKMGVQVAIMAPTEILARQHFAGNEAWLMSLGIRSDLLVGSLTPRMKEDARARLRSWETDIVFGTHALIQESVQFSNLGFVVVDEQHRFWVEQRKILEEYHLIPSPSPKREGNNTMNDSALGNIYELAKEMRKNPTETEDMVWQLLRNWWFFGFKFRRQHPFSTYIADFYCHEKKIVIEIDGKIHEKQKEYDTNRDDEMKTKWVTVFRFTNEEVQDVENFVKQLEKILAPLSGGEGLGVRVRYAPHRLNMSATPIPRTLALTLYGDQDVSVLDEYPAGRKPIHTRVIREEQRVEMYRFIDEEVRQWRQVYWISPLVDGSSQKDKKQQDGGSGVETVWAKKKNSDSWAERGGASFLTTETFDTFGHKSMEYWMKENKEDIASAVEMQITLSTIFPHLHIGLIHGKMSGKEKDQVMQDFYENKIHILSSTSVVEVGVNNPNATIICIEAAERFGLSQLHQFRGRVGRGDDQSYCYLFTTKEYKSDRLKAMEKTNDGFELAEIDLELRGPGEVYGVRQSWVPDLHFADLTDFALVSEIREDIEEWMKWKNNL